MSRSSQYLGTQHSAKHPMNEYTFSENNEGTNESGVFMQTQEGLLQNIQQSFVAGWVLWEDSSEMEFHMWMLITGCP